jgi:opacity protein-like surface antigen
MKRFFVVATMLVLLSAPAFAGKNSQTVNVPTALKAGSVELTPGDYNVTWTGSGSEVQVTFTRNRKAIVTLPAKLVDQSNKNEGLNTSTESGVEVLQAIRMSNMTLILESSPSSEK